jgi:PAS domain-containing protein
MKLFPDIIEEPVKALMARLQVVLVTLVERQPFRTIVALLVLGGALLTANRYIARTREYQAIVSNTVYSGGEETPQRFKVLEAFVMSTIGPELRKSIEEAKLSDRFSKELGRIEALLSTSLVTASNVKRKKIDLGLTVSIPDFPATITPQTAIISDNASEGFLFLPFSQLRGRIPPLTFARILNESNRSTHSHTLDSIASGDQSLTDDIQTSRVLLPALKAIAGSDALERTRALDSMRMDVQPVQVYYITKHGLNRIVNNQRPANQNRVYRNMFSASTFFPSRPYYVAASRRENSAGQALTGPAGQHFYVSNPYLDIGGFGVVVTLARPLNYAMHSNAVLAVDLSVRLNNDVLVSLTNKLTAFGAAPTDVICTMRFGSQVECDTENDAVLFSLQQKLRAATSNGELSSVVGNITVLSDPPTAPIAEEASTWDILTYPFELATGARTTPLRFAIPIGQPEPDVGNGLLKARFLVASLDLERYRQITSLYGLLSICLVAACFTVALFSWHGQLKRRMSLEEAFKTLDYVLAGDPTPYCRLNSNDVVVDCNRAFARFLGMGDTPEGVAAIVDRTFQTLLSQPSQLYYGQIQDQRKKANSEVRPYDLTFVRADTTHVTALIRSGAIAGRRASDFPDTFGIIVPKAVDSGGAPPQGP